MTERKINLPKDKDGKVLAGPGRPKGSPNRNTELLNAMYELGNKPENKQKLLEYMQSVMEKDPDRYWQIYLKLMPKTIVADVTTTNIDATNVLEAMMSDEDLDD